MIAAAQRGSERSAQELVLRHINFVSFRLHRRVFPDLLRRFGEELPKPVTFVSYIWKRINGHILDGVKRELTREKELQAEWVMTEE